MPTEFRTASQLEERNHSFHMVCGCRLGSPRDRGSGRDCCVFLWGKGRLRMTFQRRSKLSFESQNQYRDTIYQVQYRDTVYQVALAQRSLVLHI